MGELRAPTPSLPVWWGVSSPSIRLCFPTVNCAVRRGGFARGICAAQTHRFVYPKIHKNHACKHSQSLTTKRICNSNYLLDKGTATALDRARNSQLHRATLFSCIIKVIIKRIMKTSKLVSLIVVLAFACAPMAQAVKNGFDTTCTQGNGGHEVNCDTTTNQGVQETSGPHGQVKQDKTANTTTCGPGNSTGC
jgi:hypothetical protein